MIFVWDNSKNQSNKKKHSVSFEEAETVFYDTTARLIADLDHSKDEDRYILLGMSSLLKLLVVVHVYKESDEIIRIISARKASKKEQKEYKKGAL
ncbi:MAG: BrnT family toxin [Oligoflexia bacterium]|nr:BrnT family toxin [Oligoflexia bacterium]